MSIRPLYFALILISLHTVAHAQLFKCKGANDRYTFQDTPCPPDADSQARKRPKPGERDESFAQRKKDNRPGANWEPRTQVTPGERFNPPPQAAPTQANAVESTTAGSVAKSWQEKERDYQMRRAEEQTKAHNDRVNAFNQMQRCNYARQQLGILKEPRPVYRRDNNGDRQYVSDENRQAEITAAEQRVAEACK
jgi:hypothetical protein